MLTCPMAVAKYLCPKRTARNTNTHARIVFPVSGVVMTGVIAAGVYVVAKLKNNPQGSIEKIELRRAIPFCLSNCLKAKGDIHLYFTHFVY